MHAQAQGLSYARRVHETGNLRQYRTEFGVWNGELELELEPLRTKKGLSPRRELGAFGPLGVSCPGGLIRPVRVRTGTYTGVSLGVLSGKPLGDRNIQYPSLSRVGPVEGAFGQPRSLSHTPGWCLTCPLDRLWW